MPNCCVPGCGSKSSNPQCAETTFHRLPINNKEVLNSWIDNLNLKEQGILDHHRVCSEHFHSSSFRQASAGAKRCLIPGSIPIKFDPASQNILKAHSENSEDNMVHVCIVYGCKYRKKRNYNRAIIYHSFPVERERLLKWTEAINTNSGKAVHISKHSKICQMHFTSEDYTLKSIENNNNQQPSYCLKPLSVPSIFEITDSSLKQGMSEKTVLKNCQNNNNNNSAELSDAMSPPNSPPLIATDASCSSTSSLPSTQLPPQYAYQNYANSYPYNSMQIATQNCNPNQFYNVLSALSTNSNLHQFHQQYNQAGFPMLNGTNEASASSNLAAHHLYNNSMLNSFKAAHFNCSDGGDDDKAHFSSLHAQNELKLNSETFPQKTTKSENCNNNNTSTYSSSSSTSAYEENALEVDCTSGNKNNNSENDSSVCKSDANDHTRADLSINDKQNISVSDTSDDKLNDSTTSDGQLSVNGKSKKRGLSDVINKLHKQNSVLNTPSTSTNVSPVKIDKQSPQSAIINAVASGNSVISSPDKCSKMQQIAKLNVHSLAKSKHKSEIDLYRLLERANLSQYFNVFTEKGGDDLNQLLDADEEEFKEITELVGMSSKPLHVKRLRKALDEYKGLKSELNNDSLDPISLNANTTLYSSNTNISKCSTSPTAISSSSTAHDSLLTSSLSSTQSSSAKSNHASEATTSPTNTNSIVPPGASNFYFQNNDNNDDSQYDSAHSTPRDFSKYLKRRSPSNEESESSDDESHHTNDAASTSNANANGYETTMGDNLFGLKSEQNEKNAKKNKVIELYSQGERCVRKLSQMTGVPLTTVYRVIGKLKGINYNIPRGNGAGRKTILDTQDREILVEILNTQPRISRKELGKLLEKRTGKSIHNSTLNRELCRLRHHGHNFSATTSASINNSVNAAPSASETASPVASNKQSSLTHYSSSPSMTTSANTTVKKPLNTHHHQQTAPNLSQTPTQYVKEEATQQLKPTLPTSSSSLLTQPAAVLAAAAAVALGYPNQANPAAANQFARTPFFPHLQQPFANFSAANAAALAAYSSYMNQDFSSMMAIQTNQALAATSQQPSPTSSFQLDDESLRVIISETKRFCDSLPKLDVKPLNNMKPEIMKQIIELNENPNDNSPARLDTIKKLTAIVTRFDSKRASEKTYFEYCMHEACVHLCILKPALLTRREDLMKFARQLLKNVGIAETSTNGKRTSMSNSLPTDLSMNKRLKTDTVSTAEKFYQNAFHAYNNLLSYDKNYMQQFQPPLMPNLPNTFWPYGENNVNDTMKYQEELRKKLFIHNESVPFEDVSAKNYAYHSEKNEKNLRIKNEADENVDVNVDEENDEDDTVNKSRESGSSSNSDSEDEDDDEDQDSYVANENDDAVKNDDEETQHDAESENAVNSIKDDYNDDYDNHEAKTDPNNNKN